MVEARQKSNEPLEMVQLSDKQKRNRKARNIAIGLCLAGFVAIFYFATIVKFGPAVMGNKGFY